MPERLSATLLFHGFVRLSLFRPRPSASLCLRCARASSFGTRFEWTANTRAVSGGGTSNRAETGHKTKKNRSDLWCSLPAILTGSTEGTPFLLPFSRINGSRIVAERLEEIETLEKRCFRFFLLFAAATENKQGSCQPLVSRFLTLSQRDVFKRQFPVRNAYYSLLLELLYIVVEIFINYYFNTATTEPTHWAQLISDIDFLASAWKILLPKLILRNVIYSFWLLSKLSKSNELHVEYFDTVVPAVVNTYFHLFHLY